MPSVSKIDEVNSDERLEINEDVFLLLTTDDTDYTVFKAIA